MTVAIDSYSSVVTVPAGSNATINMTVSRPGLVAVALMGGGNYSHNAPKYNGSGGTNMTQVVAKDDVQDEAYMYMYVNPATGTIPFYFTETGAQQFYRVMVVLLSGVDLGNPVAGTQAWNANGVDTVAYTISHTYKAGQLGLVCGANAYTSGYSNGTATLLGSSSNSFHGYISAETDGTTYVTVNTAGSGRYCSVGAVFNPGVLAPGSSYWWW